MIEVNSKTDLRHALSSNEDVIHVADRNLCLGIIKRPYKYRSLLFAFRSRGYRLNKLVCRGTFDVKFVRKPPA